MDNKRTIVDLTNDDSDSDDDIVIPQVKRQKRYSLKSFPGDVNNLPCYWENQIDSKLDIKNVYEFNNLWKQILDFLKLNFLGMNVIFDVKIDIIQNYQKWELYQTVKNNFLKRKENSDIVDVNEVWAFHGSDINSINNIIVNGFDRSYGKVNQYGRGVYFAVESSYSLNQRYSSIDSNGWQHLLLCRILTGDKVVGSPNMHISNKSDGTSYDSMVNNIDDPKIFVIPKDDCSLAEFKISLKSYTINQNSFNKIDFSNVIDIDKNIIDSIPYYPPIFSNDFISNFYGVKYKNETNDKWKVYINFKGITYNLGEYLKSEEAGSVFTKVYRHLYIKNASFEQIGNRSVDVIDLSSSSSSSSSLSLLSEHDKCCDRCGYSKNNLGKNYPKFMDDKDNVVIFKKKFKNSGLDYEEYRCLNKECNLVVKTCGCGLKSFSQNSYTWCRHGFTCSLLKKGEEKEISLRIYYKNTDETKLLTIDRKDKMKLLKDKIRELFPNIGKSKIMLLCKGRILPSNNILIESCNLVNNNLIYITKGKLSKVSHDDPLSLIKFG